MDPQELNATIDARLHDGTICDWLQEQGLYCDAVRSCVHQWQTLTERYRHLEFEELLRRHEDPKQGTKRKGGGAKRKRDHGTTGT